MTGNVEFLRFNEYGVSKKYKFKYDEKAEINTKSNTDLAVISAVWPSEAREENCNISISFKNDKIRSCVEDQILYKTKEKNKTKSILINCNVSLAAPFRFKL